MNVNQPLKSFANRCHVGTPGTSQKLWFVNAPYGGHILRFRGEPTSLMYAIAPLVQGIKEGEIPGLSMSDVALLNPPVATVKFYDELAERLCQQEMRAICISTSTAGSAEARKIAAMAKQIAAQQNREVITILGGPHEDDIAEKTASWCKEVDFSFAGDGEYALKHLIEIIFQYPEADAEQIEQIVIGESESFHKCPGKGRFNFLYEGKNHFVPISNRPIDLNELPFMPRELVYEDDTRTFSVFKKSGRNVKTAQIMTHRGCMWQCSFCSDNRQMGNLNLKRSVERVIEEIEDVKSKDYEAIFFDDSTFTWRRVPRRQLFLKELFGYLKNSGMEWGCQTRVDQIDVSTLQEMKEAGCSYIFLGVESASDEMLADMIKDTERADIESAFQAVNEVGIRIGTSLIFGVAPLGSSRTNETKETITETLNFMERQVRSGNIVLISLNSATYYPHTPMTDYSGKSIDFREPIQHQGYPWNRFEEGEGYHPDGIDDELAEFIVRESVRRFGEFVVDQDLYDVDEIHQDYRKGNIPEPVCINLNHSSITKPVREAYAAARPISLLNDVSRQDRSRIIQEARIIAAQIMGLPRSKEVNIAFGRNTTEAASFALWLTHLHKMPGAKVTTTNAENMSIPRAFRFYMDHGNPNGRDMWSSFQDFGVQRTIDYTVRKRLTGLHVEEIDVLSNSSDSDSESLEEVILKSIDKETRLVVFSHVIRDNGLICNVKRLCSAIRELNPNVYTLVDGAQALGALPKVDVEDLGCDFYVATPHKTLGCYPIGMLYFNDRVKDKISPTFHKESVYERTHIVMKGMFAESIGIRPTVSTEFSLPEVASFTAAIRSLQEGGFLDRNSFSALDQHRRRLKEAFLQGLQKLPLIEVTSPLDTQHSNFILAFRFFKPRSIGSGYINSIDNRAIVEHLWHEHLVFVSYIARSDVIRVSFGIENTKAQVEKVLAAISDILLTLQKL